MGYKVYTTVRADRDVEEALAWYDSISPLLGTRFLMAYKERLLNLETGWAWHQIRYRSVRVIRIPPFPYLIHFKVDEEGERVRVLAVLHEKREPRA